LSPIDDGGYLVYRLWPNWKPVADSRPGLYPASFHSEYEKLWQGGQGWESYIALWRVQAILGETELSDRYLNHNLYHELAVSDSWSPVYWDRKSILYVSKEIELSASNLAPFRQLKPGLPWPALEARITSQQQWRDLGADL